MIVSDGNFEYLTEGSGTPMIFLHGLMGNLTNFQHQVDYFSSRGYEVVIPLLPLYSMPLATTSVTSLTKFVKKFIDHKGYSKVILVGNSLGGHIALLFQKLFPSYLKSIVLSGSSGLYEAAMGNSYPRRGDRDYIAERVRDLAISKSAMRHNMAEDITSFHLPVCLIWGRQDAVTPPEVADKFHELLPNSDLFWIDNCGHAAMMEHPQEFNIIVDEWLKKIEVA